MSLQYILGPSGSGKSYYLYEKVIEESIQHPDKNYIVIVPEQFTMQTQKDLVKMHPRKGIMNIDVLSFERLSYRIFEETGGMDKIVLDDEGKNLILRRLAGRCEKQLKVLGNNIRKLGYISEVKAVISEFTQYDIGVAELELMKAEAGDGTYLQQKLSDIGVLYGSFRKHLQEKYITGEELLDVLARVAGRSEILKGSVIALDGFTGFTPVQVRLLKEMMKTCSEILVNVTMGSREDAFSYKHPFQIFALGKQMVNSLMKAAEETRTEVNPPVFLGKNSVPYRFHGNPELAFLEQHLFRYERESFNGKTEHVHLHSARSIREECEHTAQQILSLIRTRGWHFRDVAVIVSDMDAYGSYLDKVMERYQIPVFLDHKRSILLNSFVEYIRSLLASAEQNFSQESVFRLLRTGLLSGENGEPFADSQIDELENYVLALGIRGFQKWKEPFIRRPKNTTEEELARLNHMRVVLVEKLGTLMQVLKSRRKTVGEITAAVCTFLEQEKLQQKMETYEKAFQETGELALAKEYAQIYRIVIELMEKFEELLGEESVALKEYCELLDAGLSEAKVGVIPPSLDQVVAGDLERTRLKDVRALFFLGINDSRIPGKLTKGGLLTERDREKVTGERIHLTPGSKEQAYIQKFYLYQNLTKPSEELYLSYSQVSADGKSMRPAYLIQDLRRLFPDLIVTEDTDCLSGRERGLKEVLMTPETGMEYVIRGLQILDELTEDRQASADWMELFSWYLRNEKWQEQIRKLVDAACYLRPGDALSRRTAEALYGDLSYSSVTRLEKFAACAYAHFLRYGLRLREREEYSFQALDWGNLFHGAIERFSRKAEEAGKGWLLLEEEERDRLIRDSVDESITDYGNSVLYSSARNEYMITRMKRMMSRTVWALTKHLARGEFEPAGYEVNFGSGKIDRIDTCEDGENVYVKIIDYKTGMQSFDITAMYYGLQIQLIVYLGAALWREEQRHPGKTAIPAGIFYYRMKDPIVSKEVDDARLEEAILKELKLDGLVSGDDVILRKLDKDMDADSLVLPASRKKDGDFKKGSKVASAEEFRLLNQYALTQEERLKKKIIQGTIAANPYEMGQRTACDFCEFKDVCRFDMKLPGNSYRRLMKMEYEEVIEKIRQEDN